MLKLFKDASMNDKIKSNSSLLLAYQQDSSTIPSDFTITCLLSTKPKGIYELSFHFDELIACGTSQGPILLIGFNKCEKKLQRVSLLCGHSYKITDFVESLQGDNFLSISADCTICSWSLRDGSCLLHASLSLSLNDYKLTTCPSGLSLVWIWAVGSNLYLFDLENEKIICSLSIGGINNFSILSPHTSYCALSTCAVCSTISKLITYSINDDQTLNFLNEIPTPDFLIQSIKVCQRGLIQYSPKKGCYSIIRPHDSSIILSGSFEMEDDDFISDVDWKFISFFCIATFKARFLIVSMKKTVVPNSNIPKISIVSTKIIKNDSFINHFTFCVIENHEIVFTPNSKNIVLLSEKSHYILKPKRSERQFNIVESDYSNPYVVYSDGKSTISFYNAGSQTSDSKRYTFDGKITAIYSRNSNLSNALQIINGYSDGHVTFWNVGSDTDKAITAYALTSPIIALVELPFKLSGRQLLLAISNTECCLFKATDVYIMFNLNSTFSILGIYYIKTDYLVFALSNGSFAVFSINSPEPLVILSQLPPNSVLLYSHFFSFYIDSVSSMVCLRLANRSLWYQFLDISKIHRFDLNDESNNQVLNSLNIIDQHFSDGSNKKALKNKITKPKIYNKPSSLNKLNKSANLNKERDISNSSSIYVSTQSKKPSDSNKPNNANKERSGTKPNIFRRSNITSKNIKSNTSNNLNKPSNSNKNDNTNNQIRPNKTNNATKPNDANKPKNSNKASDLNEDSKINKNADLTTDSNLQKDSTNNESIDNTSANTNVLETTNNDKNNDKNKLFSSLAIIGKDFKPTFFYPRFPVNLENILNASPIIAAKHFLIKRLVAKMKSEDDTSYSQDSKRFVDFVPILIKLMYETPQDSEIQQICAETCASLNFLVTFIKAQTFISPLLVNYRYKDLNNYADYDLLMMGLFTARFQNVIPAEILPNLLIFLMKQLKKSKNKPSIVSAMATFILIDGIHVWLKIFNDKSIDLSDSMSDSSSGNFNINSPSIISKKKSSKKKNQSDKLYFSIIRSVIINKNKFRFLYDRFLSYVYSEDISSLLQILPKFIKKCISSSPLPMPPSSHNLAIPTAHQKNYLAEAALDLYSEIELNYEKIMSGWLSVAISSVGWKYPQLAKKAYTLMIRHAKLLPYIDIGSKTIIIGTSSGEIFIYVDSKQKANVKMFSDKVDLVSIGPNEECGLAISEYDNCGKIFKIKQTPTIIHDMEIFHPPPGTKYSITWLKNDNASISFVPI